MEPTILQVELEAEVYLAYVHLVSERPDLVFSDNHFDLAAGEPLYEIDAELLGWLRQAYEQS